MDPIHYILPPIKSTKNKLYKNYYSDDRQDFIIEQIFQGIEYAKFVDVGAGNGIDGNNTLFFKDFNNWEGICIEENKKLFNELKMYRPSDINLNIKVTTNLEDIMNKYNYNRIQLLTFNVPNQLEILKSLRSYDIDLIEVKNRNKEETDIILFLLNNKGYKLVGKTIQSLMFLHHKSFFMKPLER
jgi:alpha-L-fucosidase